MQPCLGKSAVFLSVDDNFDKVDAHSVAILSIFVLFDRFCCQKLRDSNSRVSNAFAVHNILVGHVCVCAKERLLRVSSIEKKSDAKRLLSAVRLTLFGGFSISNQQFADFGGFASAFRLCFVYGR